MGVGKGFVFCYCFGFYFEEVRVDGAAGHFGRGCFYETELADGEAAFFVRHGWTEGAAGDGARGVEVAGAGCGVEDGAGLVVREVVEEIFVVRLGEELAGDGVAGEVAREAGSGFLCTVADAGRNVGIGCSEGVAETVGV